MASARIDRSNPSIVEWFAEHEGYRCGYCKQEDSNYSHGMWAHVLTVQDYQDLIDRGWRRSGKYCYKPTMNLTCCPHYTIRCEALRFKLSKSHKKVLKRVNRFLIKGEKSGTSEETEVKPSKGTGTDGPPQADKSEQRLRESGSDTDRKKEPRKGMCFEVCLECGMIFYWKIVKEPTQKKPPCRKAKELRKQRKLQKLAAKVEDNSKSKNSEQKPTTSNQKSNEPKTLEEFLDEPFKAENPAHKLEIKLIRTNPASQESRQSDAASYEIFRKYQMTIHEDAPDECTKKGFHQFLVDSSLQRYMDDSLREGYGAYHQQYILDGKIIAVGVVDILPYCVSSVYVYYDPEYHFLSLGTYTALQEIAFTRRLTQQNPDLKYYYMGYYIHSCPKMRYKGQYNPSFLLCPETFRWQPIEKCLPKLDQNKYSRLEEDRDKVDEDGVINVDKTLILHEHQAMPYSIYRRVKPTASDQRDVEEYARLVGRKCAERMLLFRK
ncbi:arginyl-tRNA--protein transferase 1-like [Liolophura sinensis]|uniref:arginyl-tRNA--protein transferase 1-like n=1 Tax=Liolophura sinensis TaxID=3198878 RepID=UPI00315981A7